MAMPKYRRKYNGNFCQNELYKLHSPVIFNGKHLITVSKIEPFAFNEIVAYSTTDFHKFFIKA